MCHGIKFLLHDLNMFISISNLLAGQPQGLLLVVDFIPQTNNLRHMVGRMDKHRHTKARRRVHTLSFYLFMLPLMLENIFSINVFQSSGFRGNFNMLLSRCQCENHLARRCRLLPQLLKVVFQIFTFDLWCAYPSVAWNMHAHMRMHKHNGAREHSLTASQFTPDKL